MGNPILKTPVPKGLNEVVAYPRPTLEEYCP